MGSGHLSLTPKARAAFSWVLLHPLLMAKILTNWQVLLAWAHKATTAYVWLREEGNLLHVFSACLQDGLAYVWPLGFEGESSCSFSCLNNYFLPNN